MSLTALRNSSNKYVKVIFCIAAGGMLVASFTGLGGSIFNNRDLVANQSADDVVATVNGDAITRGAFQQKLQKLSSGQPVGLLSYTYMNASALDQAVDDALTVQIAKRDGLAVSNSDLDKARKTLVSELAVSLGLSAKASESDVSEKLSENSASLDQYFNEAQVRHDLLLQKYGAFLRSAHRVTEDDVKQQYTDYHTAHILIGKSNRPDAEALSIANKVIQLLDKGGDFAALAKQYSDDPGSKNKGGDDGWVTKDTHYVPEFLAAMKTLQKGQVTQQPVASPQYGYFIIKLYDTRSSLPKDFQKNLPSELVQLQNQRVDDAYQADLKQAEAGERLNIKDDRLRLDHGVMDLYKHMGPDGKLDQGELQKLIKGYTELAKAVNDGGQVAQIDAELGALEGMTDIKDAKAKANLQIADFLASLKAFGHDDQGVDSQLAQLYQQVGDKDDAVKYLELASSVTYGNPQAHAGYASTFRALGKPDLAAKEMQLASQQGQQGPPPGSTQLPAGSAPMSVAVHPANASAGAAHPSVISTQPITIGGKPVPGGASTQLGKPIGPHPGQVLGTEKIQVMPGGIIKFPNGQTMQLKQNQTGAGKPIMLQTPSPHGITVRPSVKPQRLNAPVVKPSAVIKPKPPKPVVSKPVKVMPAPAKAPAPAASSTTKPDANPPASAPAPAKQ